MFLDYYFLFSIVSVLLFLGLTVFVPFVVMYFFGKSSNLRLPSSLLMLYPFLGCWLGTGAIHVVYYVVLILVSHSYSMAVQLVQTIAVTIVQTAFSAVFFVCMTALLLAHYQKTVASSLGEPPKPPVFEQSA